MTWTWDIDKGGMPQTLIVWNPDGEEAGTRDRESWTWRGPYPRAVADIMPETITALMALQRGDIERRGNEDDGNGDGGGR